MATSYTENRKIGALSSASTPLAATNEIVINQNGDTLKTSLSAVEAKVFDAKSAITSPSGTEVVVVRQTDNTLRQVALSNIVPDLNITNARVSASAAIEDTKLATINTAGKVTNNAVQATDANTANRIVARDGSGNFAAGTITATLSGNATTATTASSATVLATARTISLTGDVTGTTGSFNGSANVSAVTTIANDAVTTAKILDGNVTLAKLVAAVQQALVPVGAVEAFARSTAPSGWLAANGSTIGSASSGATNASSDYLALFTVLWDWSNTLLPILSSSGVASTRGASASADFNANKRLTIPDLRGYFVRGWGVAGQNGTNSDGTASGTFGAKQAHAFLNHSHTASSGDAGAHAHTYDQAYNAGPIGGYGPLGLFYLNQTATTSSVGNHSHTITVNNSTAGGTETRPANIALLYCIKF